MWAFDPIIHDIDIDLRFIYYICSHSSQSLHTYLIKYLNKVTSLFSIGLFFKNIGWDDWDSGMWENGFPNHVPPLSFWTVIFGLAWITVIAFQPESLCKVIFLKHFSHSSRDQKQSYSSLSAKHLQAAFTEKLQELDFLWIVWKANIFSASLSFLCILSSVCHELQQLF